MASSLSPPPNLPSLPRELLSHISFFLSKNDILTLARVAICFGTLIDEHVWGELHLTLHSEHYGAQPRIRPSPNYPLIVPYPSIDEEEEEARRSEVRFRVALKEKVDTILARGREAECWSRVKHLSIDPRPAALPASTEVLRLVAANLETLVLTGNVWQHSSGDSRPATDDTLDVHILCSRIFLPRLTYMRLGTDSMYFPRLVQLLCTISPNLTALDIDLSCRNIAPGSTHPSFGALHVPTTKLIVLLVSFGEGDDEEDDPSGTEATRTVLELLLASPELVRLDLTYLGGSESVIRDLLKALNDHPALHEMLCNIPAEGFVSFAEETSLESGLKTLILEPTSHLTFMSHLPFLPALERIYFLPPSTSPLPSDMPPPSSFTQSLIPAFAASIRKSPSLSSVYTIWNYYDFEGSFFAEIDRLERSDAVGFVYSYIHGEDEIIHAKLLVDSVEVADKSVADDDVHDGLSDHYIQYVARDGSNRERTFRRLSEPTWVEYSDLDGEVVPLDLLGVMRVIEGVDEGDWTGRGIIVSDAGWKVIEDWRGLAPEDRRKLVENTNN